MREADGRRLVSRVKGRPALEKRIRRLLVAAHRYGRHRACSRADVLWYAKAIDGLQALLQDGPQEGR
jgi:hypothetical protein